MTLHNISSTKHEHTAKSQFSLRSTDTNFLTKLLHRQIYIRKWRIESHHMVMISFKRNWIQVFDTCSFYRLLTSTAERLVSQHSHSLHIGSTAVTTTSTDICIYRTTKVNWFAQWRRHIKSQYDFAINIVFLAPSSKFHIEFLPITQSI